MATQGRHGTKKRKEAESSHLQRQAQCREKTGSGVMSSQSPRQRFPSSRTTSPLHSPAPPQMVPPIADHDFKFINLWGHFSSKPPWQGTGLKGLFMDPSIQPCDHQRSWHYLQVVFKTQPIDCLLYTSPSPRDYAASRMPSAA